MHVNIYYTGPGWGHKIRTLALIEALRSLKIRIVNKKLSAKNFTLDSDVSVFDTHEDITFYLQQCKENSIKTVLIDNISPARFLSDIVIYPGHHTNSSPSDWEGYKGKILGGLGYIPLRSRLLKTNKLKNKPVNQILVTFGGIDPNHLEERVARIIHTYLPTYDVISPSRHESSGNLLYSLMQQATLGITAFGTTLYEMIYLGLPQAILYNYESDEDDVQRFLCMKTSINLGFFHTTSDRTIVRKLKILLSNKSRLHAMNHHSLIDGQGALRIARAITKL